ncbi:VpsR-related response regulator [Vibrio sp. CK2-1]|uniref:sigma-54 dependent transcriptional regulator n=1 Tax=Vibrio sp. CK2-1 TaxID=2912249 RepID=UPI001F32A935|nr:VpsR-related response regulator [Vibrio sp. CK2-1]MCF7355214.1 VpsR-related response regulator [Vibrio sp. CK2-1]
MEKYFRMDSVPGSLLVIGGRLDTWYEKVALSGWKVERCGDLRLGQSMIDRIGPCIGLIDLTNDDFSLSAIAYLVTNNKHVRWMAYIKEHQLNQDPICQFIVNFCIDFFTSPMPEKLLLSSIGHQLGMLKIEKKVWPENMLDNQDLLVGDSLPTKRLREQVKRIANTDANIIIAGERGVGKRLVAKSIHDVSSRSKCPFVVVNCSALSEKRFEREVFGFERDSQPPGFQTKLEEADQGTLLLKDITALPKSQQNHLLHFINHPVIHTDNGEKTLDIRIMVSTYNDLEQKVQESEFSAELFYLLKILKVHVTPLKERCGDIASIANYYIQQFSREYNTQARSLSSQALKALTQYHWPGNVRELLNQVKRAVLVSDGIVIELEHFDLPSQSQKTRTLKMIREDSEKEALVKVLEAHDGQVSLAAKELRISRATMYRLLGKHKLVSEA